MLPYPHVLMVNLPALTSLLLRNQFPYDKLVELVKVNVAEDRGNNAALRTAAQRFLILPVLHVPGSQHAANEPEEPLVTDLLPEDLHQDLMVDGPVAVGDVTLDEPHRPGPGLADLPQCSMATAPFPETVRPGRERRLVDSLQNEAHHFPDELIPP